ncbi:MAG: hypothetical protein K8R36_06705 [Planctomycetales bacterium]|nr:hypothetical protein [Planctomycetales bacterium]
MTYFAFGLLVLLLSCVIGVVMIIGALKMMRLESYGWGLTASILALLPCSPVGLLGIVVGIWSLIVLSRRNVKEAFSSRRARGVLTEPAATISRGTQLARARILLVVALLLMPMLLLLGYWFGPRMLVAWNNEGMVEVQTEAGIRNVQVLVQRDGQQVTIIDAKTRPWAVLHPGLYQLVLISGSTHTTGQIMLSQSSLAVSGGSRQTVRVYIRKDDTAKAKADEESAADRAGWKLGPAGPALSANAIGWLKLKPDQVEDVNKILQASHQDFLALEAQNTERKTDESGHIVIIVKPFPAPVAKLEDQLWLKLDGVFSAEQQSWARLNLKLNPAEVLQAGMTLRDAVCPGFFGWAKEGAQIELWKVGTWSHWKVSARNNLYTGSAPQLPEEYQRFWKEPEKSEGKG